MPKPPALLPSGVRPTDILTATQFAAVFPIGGVMDVLEECERSTVRVRQLPSESVVYFVMMLSLFRTCSHQEVFRIIAGAFSQIWKRKKVIIPSSAALAMARARVGFEPFEKLFQKFAVPAAQPSAHGCWFKRWRIMAIDGCVLNLEDTKDNRDAFGSPTNQYKTATSPQLRFVGLMEVGTHLFVNAAIGGYRTGEVPLARKIIHRLDEKMICLADRNFFSFDLFNEVNQTGAALLFRVQRGMTFVAENTLDDDSDIITIYAASDKKKEHGLKARFIQYQVRGSKSKETIFLITNILDPKLASARELACLYAERWEYEIALDEFKTHLNVKAPALRSKNANLVKQELWGMLMAHYVVRLSMYQAAAGEKIDPDRLSFTHSINVIRRALYQSTSAFPPCQQT